MIVNMSVWESLAALRDFTYRTITFDFFEIARKWFVKMDKPSYCLCWVAVGHRPSVCEGRERMEHYQTRGATPFSFWFSRQFPQPADQAVLRGVQQKRLASSCSQPSRFSNAFTLKCRIAYRWPPPPWDPPPPWNPPPPWAANPPRTPALPTEPRPMAPRP